MTGTIIGRPVPVSMGGHVVVGHGDTLGTCLLLRDELWYLVYTECSSDMNTFAFKSVLPNLFSNLGACGKYFSVQHSGVNRRLLMAGGGQGWGLP